MDPAALQQMFDAFAARSWVVGGAVAVGLLVSLVKQGWCSAWLARRVPSRYLPFVATGLGAVGVTAAALAAGQDFRTAFFQGLASAMAAVTGHQMVVESIRGGRELVPRAPWMPPSGPAAAPPVAPP